MSLHDDLQETNYPKGNVLPVLICLDCSQSMENKMEMLYEALEQFIRAIREHSLASTAVEWEFISFQTDEHDKLDLCEHIGTFQRATEDFTLAKDLVARGRTPLAEVIILALEKLKAQKEYYKLMKQAYYQPWLVVMTHGTPTSKPEAMKTALEDVQALVAAEKLSVTAVGIGDNANQEFLSQLSPRLNPWRRNTREYFDIEYFDIEDIDDYFSMLWSS